MAYHVGIDQSYSGCAIVAISDATDEVWAQTFDFSIDATSKDPCRRLWIIYGTLRKHLLHLKEIAPVVQVCFEGYSYGSRYRREAMGELGGMLRLALYDVFPEDISTTVAPSTVKKYATGSGSAAKDKVMLHVYKRWGFEAETNDVADAYTLARIARALDGVDEPEIMAQEEVLATLRKARKEQTT